MCQARLIWGCIVLASLALACETVPPAEEITHARVMEIIQESPGEYLAAVQEVVDDSACYGPEGGHCFLKVRVVDYLGGEAGRPDDRKEGWEYETMEARMPDPWPNREIGRRRLVVATPMEKFPGKYGNLIFIVDPTADQIAELREIMLNIGG
jgi:hypothetical protein